MYVYKAAQQLKLTKGIAQYLINGVYLKDNNNCENVRYNHKKLNIIIVGVSNLWAWR